MVELNRPFHVQQQSARKYDNKKKVCVQASVSRSRNNLDMRSFEN